MQFTDLNLMEPILRAIAAEGYTEPTPIQAQAIPPILDGHDLVGCAQTGTGKTAAFSLPILQRLTETRDHKQKRRHIRALILTPTRELAAQITDNMRTYGRYTGTRCAVIYGGVNQNPQVKKLQKGIDVLIATPGRLLDLVNQGYVDLSRVEVFVLDEADRMLDMGFIHDMRRVVKLLPKQRQTLLFSATMPPAIEDLARQMLDRPVSVSVAPQATTVETIDQSVFFVDKGNKRSLLLHILKQDKRIERVLIFTRTKHGADNLVKKLNRSDINADAIHGNKSQSARERALSNFKSGYSRVLVATDIASRGIDVDDVTHVINFDLPNEPESYVHRIGRTARAGASGVAYSFCDVAERKYLRDIEKVIRLKVPVVDEHPFPAENTEPEPAPKKSKGRNRRSLSDRRSNNNGGGGSNRNRNRNRNRRRKVASDGQRQGSSKSS